jgi:O-antigen/teichoic acid export membrane protein
MTTQKLGIRIDNRQIVNNVGMTVVQNVVNALTMFIVYWFLLKSLGIEQVGIWALILSSTSIVKIANFGLSGSVIKFVATYIARSEYDQVSKIIQTAAISVTVFITAMLMISYPIIYLVLKKIVPADFISLALSVLPSAALAMALMLISGVFQASLDGCGRVDLRNFLMLSGTLLHLILIFLLVPSYGLMGAAYAKVFQNGFLLVSSFCLVKFILPFLPSGFFRWDKKIFREIIGYGSSFQLISICWLLYDPITKGLLTHLGSLALVGYFEMANKLVWQCCVLIVTAIEVLVPNIAVLKEREPDKLGAAYLLSYRLALYVSMPSFIILLSCFPLISTFWFGTIDSTFILFGVLLCLGYICNTLMAPAYTFYMGLGHLRWNLAGRFGTALLNVILGYGLGIFYGGTGVVAGWVLALSCGCLITLFSYHVKYRVPMQSLLPKESWLFLGVFYLAIVFNYLLSRQQSVAMRLSYPLMGATMVLFLITLIVWFHPMRIQLINWVRFRL